MIAVFHAPNLSALEDMSSHLYSGRAGASEKEDALPMKNPDIAAAWRQRLMKSLRDSGTSQRAVSLAAGLGPGVVNSWFKEGKEPVLDHILAVASVLGVSVSYLLYGLQIDAETEEILSLLEQNPDRRAGLLQILRPQGKPAP